MLQNINHVGLICSWWWRCRAKIVKAMSRHFGGMVIFFWWNIWNKCNWRTFHHLNKQPLEVAFLIKESVHQYSLAISKFTHGV